MHPHVLCPGESPRALGENVVGLAVLTESSLLPAELLRPRPRPLLPGGHSWRGGVRFPLGCGRAHSSHDAECSGQRRSSWGWQHPGMSWGLMPTVCVRGCPPPLVCWLRCGQWLGHLCAKTVPAVSGADCASPCDLAPQGDGEDATGSFRSPGPLSQCVSSPAPLCSIPESLLGRGRGSC